MVPTRRRFLGSIGAALLLAGCSSSDDSATTTPQPTATTVRQNGRATTARPTTTRATADETTARRQTTTEPGSIDSPDYVDPDTFSEREVTVTEVGDCSLRGTIAVPDESDTVPGVVIVHGSGPQDRDGSLGPLQPYADIARGLASMGVAVLRYDKRTFGCPEAIDAGEFTVGDIVVDDALAAIDRLRAVERVDPERVVVAGHSFGGALAPRIASRDGQLAAIALLAANARPFPILGVEQSRRLLERQGELTEQQQQQLQRARERAERLANGEFEPSDVPPGTSAPFWESLAEYDQRSAAAAFAGPIFVAQGARDRQVFPETEFQRWQETLGSRENVRFERYPEANHAFVPGPAPTQLWSEPVEAEHVTGALVIDLAEWVKTVTDAT